MNGTLLPCASKVLEKLGAAELRNRHEHDAEGGKALQRARGRLTKEAVARKDALEPRLDSRFYQSSVGEVAPSSVIRAVGLNS